MTETAPGGPALSTAQIETRILDALRDIRTHWAALLEPTRTGGQGAKSADEVTPLDRRVSLRHEATLLLNSWARVIVEERDLTHHLPLGTDALGLCAFIERWARWFSGHEASEDAAAELGAMAGQIRTAAVPKRREWVYLGDCPFVVQDWFCSGQVRHPRDSDEADPLAFCSDCGQIGPARWWEEVITGRCLSEVPRSEIPALIYRTFGRVVSRPTLHRWIKSGEFGERLDYVRTEEHYDRERVIDAVATRWLAS